MIGVRKQAARNRTVKSAPGAGRDVHMSGRVASAQIVAVLAMKNMTGSAASAASVAMSGMHGKAVSVRPAAGFATKSMIGYSVRVKFAER